MKKNQFSSKRSYQNSLSKSKCVATVETATPLRSHSKTWPTAIWFYGVTFTNCTFSFFFPLPSLRSSFTPRQKLIFARLPGCSKTGYQGRLETATQSISPSKGKQMKAHQRAICDRLYLMSVHLAVMDRGSSEDGGEVQGTVAVEKASGKSSLNTKHLLG